MVAIVFGGTGIDHLAHTVLETETGDGVSLILPVDQEHIFWAVHRRPPSAVSLYSLRDGYILLF